MRILFLILILALSYSTIHAEDRTKFKIEGMGLEESLLIYFSRDQIKESEIPLHDDKRYKAALFSDISLIYDDVLVDFKTDDKYPGTPSVDIHTVKKNTVFLLGGKRVVPIEVMHGQLPVMGFRIDNFCYLTDVKTIEKDELNKLKDCDILVLNALRIEPHYSHLNLEEALQMVDLLKPKRTYLTHISHLLGFHEELSKQLPENVYLAYDNLKIQSI